MTHLRADNCNVMLISSDFTNSDCPKKERWFKTQYLAQNFSQPQLREWISKLLQDYLNTQVLLYGPRCDKTCLKGF